MDILDLERAHESLGRFLERCEMPCARATAIARFIASISDDLQGRSYYLLEICPWLREALLDDRDACWDPEHVPLIRRAVAQFAQLGEFSEAERRDLDQRLARAGTAGVNGELPSSEQRPGVERPAAGGSQVCLPLPLVCRTPTLPGQDNGSDDVGSMAALTVALRAKDPGQDAITWNNGNALKATTDMRAFRDVADDIRLAARETMHRLADLPHPPGGRAPIRTADFGRFDVERLGFDLSIPEKLMPVAGDSIGLALAAAMLGAMIGVLRGGRALRPREDLAWTGVVLPSGEVRPVERSSLAAKVRVAGAAGLAGIVVPRGMAMLARQVAERRGWNAEIHEVGNLLEVLQHEGLLREARLPSALVQGVRRPILGKALLIGAIAVAGLTLLAALPRILDEAGVHWFPFWRPFPPVKELRVPAITLPGFSIAVPGTRDIVVQPPPSVGIRFAQITDNLGGELQGRPCVVYGLGQNSVLGRHGSVEIRDLRSDRVVRSRVIETSETPFEPRHLLHDAHYDVKAGVVADVDSDGGDEIVVCAAANPHPFMAVQVLEDTGANTLGCTGSVLHAGHLENILAYDFEGDGRLEIVAAGFHYPSRGMSLLVLRRGDFYAPRGADSSEAAGSQAWSLDRQPCAAHLVVPRLPGYFEATGVAELGSFLLGLREDDGSGKAIRVDIKAGVTKAYDYLMNVPPDLDVAGIGIIVNQPQVDQCQRWLQAGVKIDFSSPEYLERWKHLFRRTRTIQMEWVSAESEDQSGSNR
jgi:hypothetical protein